VHHRAVTQETLAAEDGTLKAAEQE